MLRVAGDTLALTPPLIVTEDQIGEIVDKVAKVHPRGRRSDFSPSSLGWRGRNPSVSKPRVDLAPVAAACRPPPERSPIATNLRCSDEQRRLLAEHITKPAAYESLSGREQAAVAC